MTLIGYPLQIPGAPNDLRCRYGASRLTFRGPPRRLDGRYLAFIGGTETWAEGVRRPYPALLERDLGEICVNFGQPHASPQAFLEDPVVVPAAQGAALTVMAAMGAANLSNRFYAVHPRRNDRFIGPSPALGVLFPQVELSGVCFTRHLLSTLRRASPERFRIVKEELGLAWAARLPSFLKALGPQTVLLWFAPPAEEDDRSLGPDPLFASAPIVEALQPLVREIVVLPGRPASWVRPRTAARPRRWQAPSRRCCRPNRRLAPAPEGPALTARGCLGQPRRGIVRGDHEVCDLPRRRLRAPGPVLASWPFGHDRDEVRNRLGIGLTGDPDFDANPAGQGVPAGPGIAWRASASGPAAGHPGRSDVPPSPDRLDRFGGPDPADRWRDGAAAGGPGGSASSGPPIASPSIPALR